MNEIPDSSGEAAGAAPKRMICTCGMALDEEGHVWWCPMFRRLELPPPPAAVYRQLEIGERVLEGDEYRIKGFDEWNRVASWGYTVDPRSKLFYRRKQTPAEAAQALANSVTGVLDGMAWLYLGALAVLLVVAVLMVIFVGGAK